MTDAAWLSATTTSLRLMERLVIERLVIERLVIERLG
jgi:hypothetical protein